MIFAYIKKSGVMTPSLQYVFINETDDHRFDESIQVSILASYNRTKIQNAVVITDRFSLTDMQTKAAEIFSKLELGKKTNGRAILYLFSPKTHSLKIEVGYALEGVLPDVKAHSLEQAAKTFTYVDRYQDFWAELINTINIEIASQEDSKEPVIYGYDFSKFRFSSGGAGTFSSSYKATAEQLEADIKKMPTKADPRYEASSDPKWTLAHYMESLKEGIGDINLPLLSTESRFFRSFTPLSNYQLYRNWKMYQAAGLDQIVETENYAFAIYRKNQPVLPIVLVKQDHQWKIQEPLSWSLFQRFEDSNQVFLKFPIFMNSAKAQDLFDQKFGQPLYKTEKLDLSKLDKKDPAQYFYFNYYWLEKSAELFSAFKLGNLSEDSLWLLLDIQNNLGRFSKYLEISSELVKRRPQDKELKRNHDFYLDAYQFSGSKWLKQLPNN